MFCQKDIENIKWTPEISKFELLNGFHRINEISISGEIEKPECSGYAKPFCLGNFDTFSIIDE